MSSKKKHRKKHFKPKTPASTPQPQQAVKEEVSSAVVTAPPPAPVIPVSQLSLIGKDVRRVAVLAGVFVLLQIILWYLFNNTGLGTSVYRLIQL